MTCCTLDALKCVPTSVLAHVAQQLEQPTLNVVTLRALYRREKTLFTRQAWACQFAGFRWPNTADVTAVVEALIAGSSVTLDRYRLARQAREELYSRRRLIPNDRQIEDWVRRAIHLLELDDRRRLDAVTTQTGREAWLPGLMREMRPGPITVLLGQLIRTAYSCDYLTLPDFRRSVYQVLERGESVHINMRGTYRFLVERYADRLVASAA